MKQTYFAVGSTMALFVVTQAVLPTGNSLLLPVLYALLAIILPKWLFSSGTFQSLPQIKLHVPQPDSALLLLLTPLFVMLNFGCSELCLWLGRLLGYTNTTIYEGTWLALLVLHALLPAITEEMVFRHYLRTWLSPFGKKRTLWLCAIFFALLHAPIAMPYALLAGLFLGILCETTDTPLYAIFMHLCNNAFSLFLIKDQASPLSTYSLMAMVGLAVLGVGALLILPQGRKQLHHLFHTATLLWRDTTELQHE